MKDMLIGTGFIVGTSYDVSLIKSSAVIKYSTGNHLYDLERFKAGSFDFEIINNTVVYQKSPLISILSWYYLLKPGGYMLISIYPDNQASVSVPLRSQLSRLMTIIPNARFLKSHFSCESIEIVIQKMTMPSNRKTFKHSGARGDLIYSLPAIKSMGGGKLYINRSENGFFKIQVSDNELAEIDALLKKCPYIDSVEEWTGQSVDFDLDSFREMEPAFINLTESYLIRFGLQGNISYPWILSKDIPRIHKSDIVIARTERYHSSSLNHFLWNELSLWTARSAFIGSKEEHTKFVKETGLEIRYEPTEKWMDIAGTINGSKLFIGNQSFAYSLAEAMKHPRVLEACPLCPNCNPNGVDGFISLNQSVIRKYLTDEP